MAYWVFKVKPEIPVDTSYVVWPETKEKLTFFRVAIIVVNFKGLVQWILHKIFEVLNLKLFIM
jgi:hypothetical protein